MSDGIFLLSIKDHKITNTEKKFMDFGSKIIWIGLALLVFSGLLLFILNPESYLASSKFLAKMTIVGILILNGFLFHMFHIPQIQRHIHAHLPSSDTFMRISSLLFISGIISILSWVSALILGALHTVPFSYASLMSLYFTLLFLGILISWLLLKHRLFPHHKNLKKK